MPAPGAAHEPTEATQEAVATLTAIGWTQADLCRLLGITAKTLRRHYRDDLDTGARHVHANLATKAVAMALAGSVPMMCFVLKTKFGWREKDRAEDLPPSAAAIGTDTDPEVTDRGEA